MIFAMCAAGLLNPRPEGTLIFRRVEVEAVAKKYVFGAEMLQRMVFNIYHEMYRWLRSRGIEPEFRLKGKYLIYDRKKFEEALSIQPPLLQKLKRKERNYSIEEKRRIIDAVVGGCSISYVSKKMGGRPPEIAKWVEEYQTSGQIRGHAKLDQHQNKLRSIIEGNPVLGPKAILSRLKGEGIQVSAASLYKFMKKLGYFRDSDGNLRRRSVAGRALQCE